MIGKNKERIREAVERLEWELNMVNIALEKAPNAEHTKLAVEKFAKCVGSREPSSSLMLLIILPDKDTEYPYHEVGPYGETKLVGQIREELSKQRRRR
jgi:hypothetical protein